MLRTEAEFVREGFGVGAVIATADDAARAEMVPLMMEPAEVPRRLYGEAMALAEDVNRLQAAVSDDAEWMYGQLAAAARTDEFTARMIALDRRVRGLERKAEVEVVRADYMIDEREGHEARLLQVEVNMISVGLSVISSRVREVHRLAVADVSRIPADDAGAGVVEALHRAWTLYGSRGVVVFVVQPRERNVADQGGLARGLRVRGVRVVRLTVDEMASRVACAGARRPLVLDGADEVAVAYMRTWYAPEDYGARGWEVRTMLEESACIAVPNVAQHLSGTKKVQQALAEPGALERFLPGASNAAARARLFASFAAMYPLDDTPRGLEGRRLALSDPERFVLKPQREGGGHNTFGKAVADKVASMPPPDLEAYILMERIFPRSRRARMLRSGKAATVDVTGELGIFGAYARDATGVFVWNSSLGSLLRSKSIDSDEGGLFGGTGAIDTPYLTD